MAGAPKENTNAEKWTLDKKDFILNDVLCKIKNREIQYLSELHIYFNIKNGGANYIIKKLGIKDKILIELNKQKPTRLCNYKNINRGCKIKNNKTKSNYITKRRNDDEEYKLKHNFRVLFRHHFKDKKEKHTFDLLGYDVKTLKIHLENLFNKKMTWSNYGSYWHIDHIKPASLFNHTNKNELKECWSLSNLQPLEAKENMSKGNKYYVR